MSTLKKYFSYKPDAHELLIVDSDIKDRDLLIEGLARNMDVVVLNQGVNPVAQIARALSIRFGTTTVHIIGKGAPGALTLAGIRVDADYLENNCYPLNTIKFSLAYGAKIVLYASCVDVGSGGEKFKNTLIQKTGAQVFASKQIVGSAALGGTWSLGTASPFHKVIEIAYPHALPSMEEYFSTVVTPDEQPQHWQPEPVKLF